MAATLTNGGGGGDVVGGGADAASGTAVCRIDADLGRQVRRCLTTAFFMQAAERQPSGASSLLKAPSWQCHSSLPWPLGADSPSPLAALRTRGEPLGRSGPDEKAAARP